MTMADESPVSPVSVLSPLSGSLEAQPASASAAMAVPASAAVRRVRAVDIFVTSGVVGSAGELRGAGERGDAALGTCAGAVRARDGEAGEQGEQSIENQCERDDNDRRAEDLGEVAQRD